MDILSRIGGSPSMVGNYPARLLDAGIIEPVRHGVVRFAAPGPRDYLRVKQTVVQRGKWAPGVRTRSQIAGQYCGPAD